MRGLTHSPGRPAKQESPSCFSFLNCFSGKKKAPSINSEAGLAAELNSGPRSLTL